MSKKVLSIALAIAMVAVMVCVGVFAASATSDVAELKAGDQVKYIFYIGEVSSVGGLSVDSTYNPEYLKINGEPTLLMEDGLGAVNDLVEGQVRWNDTFANGKDFNNTDIFVITFDVVKDGTVDDLGLSYECTEFFDINAMDIGTNPADYVFARIEVVQNTTSSDVTSSETVSSETVSSETVSSETVSSETVSSETVSSETVSSETVSSETVSSETSSTTSTTSNTSSNTSSDKKDTGDASKASSSKSTSSAKTTSTGNNNNVSTVQTAGTVAVASLVVVLMCAAGVVVFAKKRSELE